MHIRDYTVITFATLGGNLGPQSVGLVAVFDSTAPDSFDRSRVTFVFCSGQPERTFAFVPTQPDKASYRERVEATATTKVDAVAVALPEKARPLEVADSAPVKATIASVRFYQPAAQSGPDGRVIVRYLVPLTPIQTIVVSSLAKLFATITPPLVAIFLLRSGQTTDSKKRKRYLLLRPPLNWRSYLVSFTTPLLFLERLGLKWELTRGSYWRERC